MNPTPSNVSRKVSGVCLGFAIAFVLAGCQGMKSSSPTTPTGPTPPASDVTVSLNQSSVILGAGATSQFTATVKNTSNTSVTWSVNGVAGGNSSFGTINATGLYTAPSLPGSYTVAATSVADTAASAKASVAVGMVGAISPATALILPTATQQYTAPVEGFSNTAVNWSVDQIAGGNSSVGTITSGGLYTAPAQNGTHTITAVSVADSSVMASASVTVTTLSIAPATSTLIGGSSQTFTPTLPDVSSPTITWTATGGTISSNGVYTAPSTPGTYTITATDSTLTATSTVTVFEFSISPPSSTVAPSGTLDFTASIQGLSNQSVTWSVNGVAGGNSTVGTINSSGVYTAPPVIGPYTVTATSVAAPSFNVSAAVTVINAAPSAVLTYHNDDKRDGQYLEEVTLTPQNVNSEKFGKLLSYPVDAVNGQIYAQPLYVPQLNIAGGTHDVVFVTTQNNSVYAFDADATSPQTAQTFWHVNFGTPVTKNSEYGVAVVGILSTPVIDATTNTMYLVAEESGKGDPTPYFLYGLDISSGATVLGPVNVNGSVPGTGGDSSGGSINLEASCYQRMGLALDPVSNAIYVGFGDCTHGWLLAYDKTTLAQTAIFNATPDGDGGGLWSSGGAPAIDDTTGDLYLLSGVDELSAGVGDPVTTGYNDSFLRLNATDLSVLDYFTPDDNSVLATNDADLGSGGNILLPASSSYPHETIGGGKDGNLFVVNRDNMGGYNPNPPENNVVQEVQICADGDNNIFSTPVYWNGSIYFHCNDDVLRAFAWNSSTGMISPTPTSKGTAVYQMHGATPSLSANGNVNGIIWDIDNSAYTGSNPAASGPCVLHAYNASNVASELYNSSQAGTRDTAGAASKFTSPTIANGKVFVPTSTELDIYGLLTP